MPAKSKKQQQFFGIADAMKSGKMKKSGEAGKVSTEMTKKQIRDFAGTKTKGLPTKVSKKKSPLLQDYVPKMRKR